MSGDVDAFGRALLMIALLKEFAMCGVVGFPGGERCVCQLRAGHSDDYHEQEGVRWIGYFDKPKPR